MGEYPSSRFRTKLAPGFIAAMPHLLDPNFHRSVVLLLRHNDEGAFGLVINRASPITMSALLEEQEIPFFGESDPPIMIGGPVELDRHLLVLHGQDPVLPSDSASEIEIADGIYLITAREGLVHLAAKGAPRCRCYVGYAGWGPGQLEAELREGSWVPLPADRRLVFDTDPDTVWENALRKAGIDPVALVPGGEIN